HRASFRPSGERWADVCSLFPRDGEKIPGCCSIGAPSTFFPGRELIASVQLTDKGIRIALKVPIPYLCKTWQSTPCLGN
ncbi:MAG: hypothetical protein WA005_00150, partial [Candidatus Binataceae bacterium]